MNKGTNSTNVTPIKHQSSSRNLKDGESNKFGEGHCLVNAGFRKMAKCRDKTPTKLERLYIGRKSDIGRNNHIGVRNFLSRGEKRKNNYMPIVNINTGNYIYNI